MPCLPPLGLRFFVAMAKANESGSSCIILSVMIASNSSSMSGAWLGAGLVVSRGNQVVRARARARIGVRVSGQGQWSGSMVRVSNQGQGQGGSGRAREGQG